MAIECYWCISSLLAFPTNFQNKNPKGTWIGKKTSLNFIPQKTHRVLEFPLLPKIAKHRVLGKPRSGLVRWTASRNICLLLLRWMCPWWIPSWRRWRNVVPRSNLKSVVGDWKWYKMVKKVEKVLRKLDVCENICSWYMKIYVYIYIYVWTYHIWSKFSRRCWASVDSNARTLDSHHSHLNLKACDVTWRNSGGVSNLWWDTYVNAWVVVILSFC